MTVNCAASSTRGQAGGAGVSDGEVADHHVGMGAGLGQGVSTMAGHEGGGEPGLGEPSGVWQRRERVAVSPVAVEPVDHHAEEPLLAIQRGRRKRWVSRLALLEHRLDPLGDHRSRPAVVDRGMSPGCAEQGDYSGGGGRDRCCSDVRGGADHLGKILRNYTEIVSKQRLFLLVSGATPPIQQRTPPMPTSEARIQANRQNSTLSTGPRTDEGESGFPP